MKFNTNTVFHACGDSLIDYVEGEAGPATSLVKTIFGRVAGRSGNRAAFKSVHFNDEGVLSADGNVAGRAGRGASFSERLSVPLMGINSNATPSGVVHYDVARTAGLLGSAVFQQDLGTSATASTLTYTTVQTTFPNMTVDQAKKLSSLVKTNCTSDGNYSEIYYRLIVLASDLHAGVAPRPLQIGNINPHFDAILDRLWPAIELRYESLIRSFERDTRSYFMPGFKGSKCISAGVTAALWHIVRPYMGVDAALQACANAYSTHAQFSERINIYLMGPKGARTIIGWGARAQAVPAVTVRHCFEAIDYVSAMTGDLDGLEMALRLFCDRLPFPSLWANVTHSLVGERCAGGFGDACVNRLNLTVLMHRSFTAGAAVPDIADAYNLVFGANAYQGLVPSWGAPRPDFGSDIANYNPDFINRECALHACGLINGLAASGAVVNLNTLSQFNRMELVTLKTAMEDACTCPLRVLDLLGVAIGAPVFPDAFPAAGPTKSERITKVGSCSGLALPAQNLVCSAFISASNGLEGWVSAMLDPSVLNTAHSTYKPFPYAQPDEVMCSITIVSAYIRCLADESARAAGRCSNIDTLLSGQEVVRPGGAAVWTDEALYHSAGRYMGKLQASFRSELDATRGCLVRLWPILAVPRYDREVVAAPHYGRGGWDLSVCFTPLQVSTVCGLESAVGGLILSPAILTHMGKTARSFLNRSMADSDMSRSNRMHMAVLAAGINGHSLTFDYVVTYTSEEYCSDESYTIPGDTECVVRSEGTMLTEELLTSCLWKQFLVEETISITSAPLDNYHSLTWALSGTRDTIAPAWTLGRARALASFDPSALSPGLTVGLTPQFTHNWRSKVPLPARAAVNDADALTWLLGVCSKASGYGRRLVSPGVVTVVAPWCSSGGSKIADVSGTKLSLIDGESRFATSLRARLGLPAYNVAPVVKASHDAVQALVKECGTSPAALSSAVSALQAAMDKLMADRDGKGLDDASKTADSQDAVSSA